MIGLEEAIRYTQSALKAANLVDEPLESTKHRFVTEQRIKCLENVLTSLKAVHLSVELECPKFRRLFSEQLENDEFIGDKHDVQQYILRAQQLDRDAKEAYDIHKNEYNTWLDNAGGTFTDE